MGSEMCIRDSIILETSASAAVEVDVDLLFDRFRWAELSLGFASTGNSLNEEVSSGLWELNDVTRNMNVARVHLVTPW